MLDRNMLNLLYFWAWRPHGSLRILRAPMQRPSRSGRSGERTQPHGWCSCSCCTAGHRRRYCGASTRSNPCRSRCPWCYHRPLLREPGERRAPTEYENALPSPPFRGVVGSTHTVMRAEARGRRTRASPYIIATYPRGWVV
jgi:hypothetical protein